LRKYHIKKAIKKRKPNKYVPSSQELCEMIKRPNLRTHVIEEVAEIPTKVIENLLNKNAKGNFPTLWKDMDIQIQESFRTPKRHDQKGTLLHHIIVKMQSLDSKEGRLKDVREKYQLSYKGKPIVIK
jgi:hypothetical protein